MLSIQNTSETTLQYIDTQNVSTENDVCHYLRTQLLILINNANTRTVVGSFIEMWMAYRYWFIGTKLMHLP